MKAFCNKCQKITDFETRTTAVKAGDNGFSHQEYWYCTECGFAPFIKPQEEKN